MRGIQKLVRNGNATQVTIPRAVLHWLGWLTGEDVLFEVLEDKSILFRRVRPSDFAVPVGRKVLYDLTPPEAK